MRKKNKTATDIYFKEDLSKETLEKRRELLPKLKEEREKGKLAYIRGDKLIVREPIEGSRDKRKRNSLESPNTSPSQEPAPAPKKKINKTTNMFDYMARGRSASLSKKSKKLTKDIDNVKHIQTRKTPTLNQATRKTSSSRLVTVRKNDYYPPTTSISAQRTGTYQPEGKYIHIATYNTLTLRTDEALLELTTALRNITWSIIGLSEVRRLGEKIEEHEKFILYRKGETPGKHGVGFLIKKGLKNQIEEIIGISERIAILNINIPLTGRKGQ